MAIFNSFTFDNENSLGSGIYITGEAVFNAPKRVVEMVNVPGRNGAIAIDEGRFENIPVKYPAGCFADNMADFAEKVANFRNILASRFTYKRLEDTYYPDEFRMGLYRSGLEVDVVNQARAGKFDIEFDCKPQRFLKSGEIPVEYTPGQTPSDEQTKTGSIVTFEAEEGTIISDIKADINPVQDLHGYDKPWAGGNGKNKLPQRDTSVTSNGITITPNSDGSVTISGTNTASRATVIWFSINTTVDNRLYLPADSYVISANNFKTNCWIGIYKNNDGVGGWEARSDTGGAFTVAEGDYVFPAIRIAENASFSTPVKVYPMIRKSTDSDTWEPYSNICPISGLDSVKVTRTGKNFLPTRSDGYTSTGNGITATFNSDGSVTLNGTATATAIFNLISNTALDNRLYLPQGDYILNGESVANNNFFIGAYRNADSGTWPISSKINGGAFSIGEGEYIFPRIRIGSGVVLNNVTVYPMIRLASETDATYEPYQGNTYTIDLNGTRYGCTLDVTSGVLKVCPYYASYNGETLTGEWISDRDEYSPNTSPTIGAQVVNIGGSLTTVRLTPTEVKALLGVNNVWADSGDITVKYGTSPYIIVNPTDFPSKPLLEVTGVGSFWLGDTQITITGTSGQIIYIDCETGECYKVTGEIISPANGLVTLNRLDFPKLASGINNIQLGSGISKVKITPRWWRL